MPTYVFQCDHCEESWERILRMSEYDLPCGEPCPHCATENKVHRVPVMPNHGDPFRMGITKPDSGFKEVLQRIHKRTPGSNLNTSSTLTKL